MGWINLPAETPYKPSPVSGEQSRFHQRLLLAVAAQLRRRRFQRFRPKLCSRSRNRCEERACRRLFRKGWGLALRQADLKHVEGVPDQRVVADDADHLDEALFAEGRDRLGKARIGQPLRAEDLVADAVCYNTVHQRLKYSSFSRR